MLQAIDQGHSSTDASVVWGVVDIDRPPSLSELFEDVDGMFEEDDDVVGVARMLVVELIENPPIGRKFSRRRHLVRKSLRSYRNDVGHFDLSLEVDTYQPRPGEYGGLLRIELRGDEDFTHPESDRSYMCSTEIRDKASFEELRAEMIDEAAIRIDEGLVSLW